MFLEYIHHIVRAVEIGGIAIVVLGAVVATITFLARIRPAGFEAAYGAYRVNLGRAILLGLEFLVAADIIGTVAVRPTIENVGVLALIVVVRTFLSLALEVEINGRWPWDEGRAREQRRD